MIGQFEETLISMSKWMWGLLGTEGIGIVPMYRDAKTAQESSESGLAEPLVPSASQPPKTYQNIGTLFALPNSPNAGMF